LEVRQTDWNNEISKEVPPEYVEEILKKIFPLAKIENIRNLRITGVDWRISLDIDIDDKFDHLLGITGRISLDEKTTLTCKEKYQLFINTKLPKGHFILIDNNKIDKENILSNNYCEAKARTNNEFETKSFVIDIAKIKNAIILCHPPLEWWLKSRSVSDVQ